MQNSNKLTDAGVRMLVEGLKGNCTVTEVGLVSSVWSPASSLLLTFVEQGYPSARRSQALEQEVQEITRLNKDKPEQRRAEVAAIKEVFVISALTVALLPSFHV